MASLYSVSLDEAESAELGDILNTMGRLYGSYQVYYPIFYRITWLQFYLTF